MIRVALIGYGYWGPRLARNLAAHPGIRLALICDPSPDSLGRSRLEHPDVAVHQDAEVALRSAAIDAIVIATPATTHFALARAALRTGKHVLVEKPFTTSVAHAELLLEESLRRRCVLMVDHTYVLSPAVRTIRGILQSGELGHPVYYDSARLNPGIIRSDVNVVWDLAAHDLAMLDYLIPAAPDSIVASGTALGTDRPAQAAWLTLQYPGGFAAHLHASWISPVKTRRVLLGGSERLLVFDDLEPVRKISVVDAPRAPVGGNGLGPPPAIRTAAVEATEPLRLQVEHFVECILSGTAPLSGARAGLRVVTWLEAAEQSLRSGLPVSIRAFAEAAA